jgi:hypothetical protein
VKRGMRRTVLHAVTTSHAHDESTGKPEVQQKPTKAPKARSGSARISLPRKPASHAQLSDFFDRHDGVDLFDQGIMAVDPDHEDLERMLLEYWSQPNTK